MNRIKYFLSACFILLYPIFSYTQEKGFMIFSGETKLTDMSKKKDEVVSGVKIVVTKENSRDVVKEVISDKKGKFEFQLPFGTDYRIDFSLAEVVPAYIMVYGSQVPKENYNIMPPIYETKIILKSTKEKAINKYKCAYEKAIFDKKRKYFVADENHKNMFINGTIICDEILTKSKPVITNTTLAVTDEKKINIGGKFLVGENPSMPLVNTVVYLLNTEDKILETTSTNLLGAFVFTGFIQEKDNVLRVMASNASRAGEKKIFLTGKEGKEVQTTISDTKGGFEFRILESNKDVLSLLQMEDSQLKTELIGKLLAEGKPVVNSKLNLKNEEGILLQSTLTDTAGKFTFKDITAKQVVVIAIDPSANIKTGSKVTITNEQGKPQKELIYKPGESFEFKMLPQEQKELSRYYADDPWLKVVDLKNNTKTNKDVIITENVYFNAGDFKILPEAQKVLDKVIAIMLQLPDLNMELGAHTDSKGSDQLNLELSKKRAEAAVAYMLSKKINANRLKGIGYGETAPVNKCKNNIECTEEEHSQNRRIEFKILK